jgi:pimeloyl-ACP methyl ester carboxylesterase
MIEEYLQNGMSIRRIQAEDPKGTLLYIHGLGESGLCFEELISDPRLKEWLHLVPDMPGYGRSSWTAEPMSLQEQADHLAQWIQARSIAQPVILGHSMGSVVAQMICEKHRKLIRAFINVEGNISFEDCSFSSRVGTYSLEDWLEKGFKNVRDAVYKAGLSDKAMHKYYYSLRRCDPQSFRLNGMELVEFSRTEDLAERMARLEMPHIYILGDPRGTGKHSRSLLTKAGVEWLPIENAGHWPFIDQQPQFIDELLKFLNNLSPL